MTKTESKVQRLAGIGILAALVIVLQLIASYFPTKPFAITFTLVPIIVGSAIYGEKAGAILGGVFGVVVIAMCVSGVELGGSTIWAANPFLCTLVCMAKGAAAGWAAGVVYKLLQSKNTTLATFCAGIVAPIVNSGVFALGLLLFFRPVLYTWAGGNDIIYHVLFVIIGVNFLIELGINMLLAPIIVRILHAVKRSSIRNA